MIKRIIYVFKILAGYDYPPCLNCRYWLPMKKIDKYGYEVITRCIEPNDGNISYGMCGDFSCFKIRGK